MRPLAVIGIVVAAIVAFSVTTTNVACSDAPTPVQRGLVLPTWERNGYSTTDTAKAMQAITSVGANWVQVVPTWYQATRTSSDLEPNESTVTDDDLRHVIGLARVRGLKVLLKPHVDPMDGTHRTRIEPSDPDAWFRSYQRFITHYADIGRELGVEEFAVGTELRSLSGNRADWLAVVQAVRSRYRGPLVYAANHDEYQQVTFWDAVDLVGIDAYWQLSPEPTADVSRLQAAFAPICDRLAEFSRRVNRRVLFTEAGYPSQTGSAVQPWDASPGAQPAGEEQAAAYEALLRTFTGQPWWAGVFWWTWTVQHVHHVDPPQSVGFSVQGKPAESVLRRWWAGVPGAAENEPSGR
ncbi:glycoside hydrolase family 113 [Mycolicibacterium litorale]|uniref:Glycoside hydrolase family 5 domain-containing protein n=1 Tax=Mycolicibacterium litorale TaxID=758802 RepID=A0AAD1MX25_9MYCO|nr:hypothetical protein [Mycolicibacterium litorale]MCV7418121.1 hypothetical protein [Mycolicibacterium litorale]TDY06492.1 hypothetical protein BCL50_2817 [Mycolicibacterium litorale]BBY19363.1 hypothetical protein MLIT_49550 [Mycolicibacterium litorale]